MEPDDGSVSSGEHEGFGNDIANGEWDKKTECVRLSVSFFCWHLKIKSEPLIFF
jgi:hypothetical protein